MSDLADEREEEDYTVLLLILCAEPTYRHDDGDREQEISAANSPASGAKGEQTRTPSHPSYLSTLQTLSNPFPRVTVAYAEVGLGLGLGLG